MDRISTGVEGLDRMLNGGLIPARPYVISGPSGSGKTILAMHFLLEGIRHGEPCLLVTLDEPPNEVKSNMAHFGWNLDRLKILDATPDVKMHKKTKSIIDVGSTLDVRDMEDVRDIRRSQQLRAIEVSIHSIQKMLKQEFFDNLEATGQRYKRIVLDSLTALKLFSMRGEDSRILIQSFMRFLSELEATTILVSERLNASSIETDFFLSRGEIRLHKWIDGQNLKRAASIERFRGSSFDDVMRPMTISDRGISVQSSGRIDLSGKAVPSVDISYLRGRVIDVVDKAFDQFLQDFERAQKSRADLSDVNIAFSRALLLYQRRNYAEALKNVLQCQSILNDRIRAAEANGSQKREGGAP